MNKLGGLWLGDKKDKNGNPWFSGEIKGQRVVVMKNTFKQPGEKTPDYIVYEQEERKQAPKPEPVQDDIQF